MHELSEKLLTAKSNISIISLNAQSINAKFEEFQIAINAINKKQQISVICIQESWLSSECSTKLFEQLISKGKYCSNHGGLLIYVHNDYLWEPITIKEQTTMWENLFIKIRHKSSGSKISNYINWKYLSCSKRTTPGIPYISGRIRRSIGYITYK